MIFEWLSYLFTPCPASVRSMGFLASTVEVRARHGRCRRAWASHLDATRKIILDAVGRCERRRKVVVLGGGMVHDIPLRELSEAFETVLLVDVVHPWAARRAALRYRNIRRVTADVTEAMESLRKAFQNPGGELPRSRPMRFIDDPELDLTLSVNLLSQLPHVPDLFLEGRLDEAEIEAFGRHLVEAHLDYLCRLPGHVALITDTTVRWIDRNEDRVEEWSAICGVELPPADAVWEWRLAPSPEYAEGVDLHTVVAGFADFKGVGCG